MNDNRDHLRALLAAYNEVTGFDLALLPARQRILRDVDRAGLTPDDIRAVLRELKRLILRDPQHYPESSLDFGNAIANVERLDTRARRLRQRAAARATRLAKTRNAQRPSPPIASTPASPTNTNLGTHIAEQLRQFRTAMQ